MQFLGVRMYVAGGAHDSLLCRNRKLRKLNSVFEFGQNYFFLSQDFCRLQTPVYHRLCLICNYVIRSKFVSLMVRSHFVVERRISDFKRWRLTESSRICVISSSSGFSVGRNLKNKKHFRALDIILSQFTSVVQPNNLNLFRITVLTVKSYQKNISSIANLPRKLSSKLSHVALGKEQI